MSSFREKTQLFIMGLMAGLIIAGGFFILKLDTYFKELNFYKNIVKTFTFKSANKDNETPVKPEEEVVNKNRKTKGTTVKNKVALSPDTSTTRPVTSFVLDADTIAKHTVKDSVLTMNASPSQEDIVIRKDELLLTKTIEVINLTPPANQSNAKDSLLQKVSGIKDDKNVKQYVNVELWKSPLNYKGYKMGKYKVVLYGIVSLEGLKVYSLEGDTYLKYGTMVYHIENTSEFKPYERITDETVISKLN